MPLSAGTRKTRRPYELLVLARQSGRAGEEARRQLVLHALQKPRTQAELRNILDMSNSGILHLLRHLERDGLVRPAERIGHTRIWEKVPKP